MILDTNILASPVEGFVSSIRRDKKILTKKITREEIEEKIMEPKKINRKPPRDKSLPKDKRSKNQLSMFLEYE